MRIALGLIVSLTVLWSTGSMMANAALSDVAEVLLVAQVETAPAAPPAGSSVSRDTDGEDKGAKALPPAPPQKMEGDIIRLKNGAIISGVQVIRVTPRAVVAQVHPNLDPLEIPRRQVASIEYDDKNPLSDVQRQNEVARPQPDIFIGEELAPEFYRKLTAPISENPIIFQNIDCVALLADLSERTGVTIEISNAVREIPQAERVRHFEIPPNMSLLSFLQDSFQKNLTELKVFYSYDKVVVTTHAAAETNAMHHPPAPSDKPSPASRPAAMP